VSTDLYLHVATGITEGDLRIQRSHTAGSYDFAPGIYHWEARRAVYYKLIAMPSCWVGELVWQPPRVSASGPPFVYDPVARIADLLGSGVTVLDEKLSAQILAAFVLSTRADGALANPQEVREFLYTYRDQPVCAVCW
jgi:hypothetical protein